MVKINKVYTKQGDHGQTRIAGGHCMAKDSKRMVVIGEIDELNSYLGFAKESLKNHSTLQTLTEKCLRIQHELFNLGASLAVLMNDRKSNTPKLIKENITILEQEIDIMNTHLPVLNSFVIPGGSEEASRLHLARTNCRRVERSLVKLADDETLDAEILPYINRLSDWLFVAARYVNYELNQTEILWNSN